MSKKRIDQHQALRDAILETIRTAGANGISAETLHNKEPIRINLPPDPKRRGGVMTGVLRSLAAGGLVFVKHRSYYYDPVKFPIWQTALWQLSGEERELLANLVHNPELLESWRESPAVVYDHLLRSGVKIVQGPNAEQIVHLAMRKLYSLSIIPYLQYCNRHGITVSSAPEEAIQPPAMSSPAQIVPVAPDQWQFTLSSGRVVTVYEVARDRIQVEIGPEPGKEQNR